MRETIFVGELLGIGSFGEGEHADVYFAKLPCPARLLLVPITAFAVGLDRFTVRNLGLVRFNLHVVAALQPLLDERELQLAHSGEHHLLGFGIVLQMDRTVFLGDLVERS